MALFAIVLLFIFNPEMGDFKVFVGEESERILLTRAGDSELGRILSDVGSSLAGDYVDRITEREDYFLFSTYRIDLDGPDETENEWRFLGIGGQFIEMQRPVALEGENGAD
jgi:hypothetical protein